MVEGPTGIGPRDHVATLDVPLITAIVEEIRGRDDYNRLGEFKFAALPHVGDLITLSWGGTSKRLRKYVVTECEHYPAPAEPEKVLINRSVTQPLVALVVRLHHESQG
jgi:hypothetical protein